MTVKEFNKIRGSFVHGAFLEARKCNSELKEVKVTTESIMAVEEELIEAGIEYEQIYRLTREPITNTYCIEIYLDND